MSPIGLFSINPSTVLVCRIKVESGQDNAMATTKLAKRTRIEKTASHTTVQEEALDEVSGLNVVIKK